MDALAGLGDNVVCKLSGLAMPLGSMSVDAFAPWLEPAIEPFGVDRCMFASNFPVDGMHGTFDELYSTFDDGDRRARRRVARQALRRQRRAHLPLLRGRRALRDLAGRGVRPDSGHVRTGVVPVPS